MYIYTQASSQNPPPPLTETTFFSYKQYRENESILIVFFGFGSGLGVSDESIFFVFFVWGFGEKPPDPLPHGDIILVGCGN